MLSYIRCGFRNYFSLIKPLRHEVQGWKSLRNLHKVGSDNSQKTKDFSEQEGGESLLSGSWPMGHNHFAIFWEGQSPLIKLENIFGGCLKVTSCWPAILLVSPLTLNPNHTSPYLNIYTKVDDHFKNDPTSLSFSNFLFVSFKYALWSLPSLLSLTRTASSAALISCSTTGLLESLDDCRLRWEYIHTPQPHSH